MQGKRNLINRRQVEQRVGLSRWAIARLEKQRDFPQHVNIIPGRHHWFEDEIDAHLERLAAGRDQVAA